MHTIRNYMELLVSSFSVLSGASLVMHDRVFLCYLLCCSWIDMKPNSFVLLCCVVASGHVWGTLESGKYKAQA